jgi:hypothetical protein
VRFKVLKSSLDGISGGSLTYDSIDVVLREISYHRGWDSVYDLHKAVREWAGSARPGDTFCTQVTAIVAVDALDGDGDGDVCPYCTSENGLDYEGEISPLEDGHLEQDVGCLSCGRRWTDVFALIERRERAPRGDGD